MRAAILLTRASKGVKDSSTEFPLEVSGVAVNRCRAGTVNFE